MANAPRDASAGTGLALLAAAVALLAITMGSRSVLGLFVSPLNSATGLGVASISFAFALSQLTWGAAQPLCGMLAERIGPARIILAGTLLGAACGAMLPFASSAPLLATVLALSGVAAAVGSPPLLIGAVSPRVPPARRALVAGVIGCGMPLGQLVLAPATQATIALAGWASAAFALAALSLASVPLALAFRRPAAGSRAAPGSDAPLRAALASPRYWLVNATFFVCGVHGFFLMTHLPGVVELCGLPASVSGLSLAVLGLFNIAGAIASGLVIERYSMQRTLALLYAARAAGIGLFMAAPKSEVTVLVFSAWMGLTYMAVLPPTAGLIGKLYGTQRLSTLLGITFMVHQAGAFLGGWLGGIALERTGSYDAMWLLDLGLACLAAAASITLREPGASSPGKRAIEGTASPVARAAA